MEMQSVVQVLRCSVIVYPQMVTIKNATESVWLHSSGYGWCCTDNQIGNR